MRKEKKSEIRVAQTTGVQAYHGRNFNNERYAFEGFTAGNYYYTSDRKIKLDEHFRRPDGKPMKGYGFEIETECFSGMNRQVLGEVYERIIFNHFPEGLFKMQTDGSLNCDSAECITQVMTREAVRNCYPAFKAMFDTYFPTFGISATQSGNCGMHINISNACFGATEATQETAIRKLHYIVNKHIGIISKATGREHITQFCQQMRYDNIRTCAISDIPTGHGVCFNWAHYRTGRIELRIVGGQRNFSAFRNTCEVVFHLVDKVKDISWKDCDDIFKVFEGCNTYVLDSLSRLARTGVIDATTYARVAGTAKRVEYL